MTVQTRIEPAATLASLNFLRPMAERPVSYQYDPPPGVPQRSGIYDAHPVLIRDARSLARRLSLDVEGVALVDARAAISAFDDTDTIRGAYYAQSERLIADAAGAVRVIVFDHNVRNAARAARGEPGVRGPVQSVHNDFTVRSGRERAERELAARGLDAALLERRFAIVNLWRAIGRPVEKSPLAIGDARTIAPGNLIATDLVYRDRVGETYAVTFSPAQRWYQFPRATPDEAILIKGFDSDESVARFAPHSAFEDPGSRADAPERESIEVRALVLY